MQSYLMMVMQMIYVMICNQVIVGMNLIVVWRIEVRVLLGVIVEEMLKVQLNGKVVYFMVIVFVIGLRGVVVVNGFGSVLVF